MNEEKRKWSFPHTYVILIGIIVIMAVCTYFIPAGSYSRVEDPNTGRMVVDPASFTYVEQSPVGLFQLINAIPEGMVAVSEIMVFIFIVGGSFNIAVKTGAIEAGIGNLAYRLKDRGKLLIPMLMFIFSLGGATFGMSEETIVFIPIGIALARALGYDALVGVGMIVFGAAIGFASGWMNPFTVGVAQGIAELPLYSGIGLRLCVWVVLLIAVPLMFLRYANKIKADPTKSIIYDLEIEQRDRYSLEIREVKMTISHILVLLTLAAGILVIVYGVVAMDWYVLEIAGVFLAMGIVSGAVAKKSPNEMARDFIEGAKDIAIGALIVGIARGILVVMTEGSILDTIIYSLSGVISLLPKAVAAVCMFFVQCVINFFIPSGSGQASATMPIMVPLADVIGLTRQTAVMAFHFGDGFTNAIIPTHGTLCACLGIAGIPFDKWFRFAIPIVAVELVICSLFMVVATVMNYGPF